MVFRLVAISLRQVLRLLLLRCRSSRSKDLELLVLRQELDVMRRQVPRPRFRPEERMVLSVLGWLRPAKDRLSSLVTPETLRRWHRELVRSKWRFHHGINPRPRIPEEVQLLVWRLASENRTWGYRRIHEIYRRLMVLQSRIGRSDSISSTWQQLQRSLADLELDPAQSTTRLYQELIRRNGTFDKPNPAKRVRGVPDR